APAPPAGASTRAPPAPAGQLPPGNASDSSSVRLVVQHLSDVLATRLSRRREFGPALRWTCAVPPLPAVRKSDVNPLRHSIVTFRDDARRTTHRHPFRRIHHVSP